MYTESTATISACSLYRYDLVRLWACGSGTCLFVMLNPSRADGTRDDPTIRRCVGFAKTWGFAGMVVVNLFAFRATDPAKLKKSNDPVGPRNDDVILSWAGRCTEIIFAWGCHGRLKNRDEEVKRLMEDAGVKPKVLGLTKAGHPRHPLYSRSDIVRCVFG